VIINSFAGFIWDFTVKPFPTPFGTSPLLGSLIGAHQAGTIAVTLAMLLLFVFFRYTRIGLAMRAAAANPTSAKLVGIRVGWMTALGWGMAAAIGSVAGMLIAPVMFLEPNMMLSILLYGFAGAVLGGLTSPGGAVARRLHRRRRRKSRGHLHSRHRRRTQAHDRAGRSSCGAGVETERIVWPLHRRAGVSHEHRTHDPRPAASPGRPRRRVASQVELAPDRRPGAARAAAIVPFFLKNFVVFQITMVDDLRHRDPGAEHADRLQRPVLARPQRLLRRRRLYGGDPDGASSTCPYVWTLPIAGLSASSSASCSACRRCG
jgi:hypothetical protein